MDGGVDGDLSHTGEVDGALAEEAGVTGGALAEDVVFGVTGEAGAGEFRGGGAEGGDDGDIEGGGDVHGAGVIGEEGLAAFEEGAELAEGGFTGDAGGWGGVGVEESDLLLQLTGEVLVCGASEDEDLAPGFLLGDGGGLGEAIEGPAFGGAVFGSGVESDPVLVFGDLEGGAGLEDFFGCDVELRGERVPLCSEGCGEVEVEVDLVGGGGGERFRGMVSEVAFTGFLGGTFAHADVGWGVLERVGEEPAAGGGGEADAVGDGGEPEFEG